MGEELFSARQGRQRTLTQPDFASLIWTAVVRLRRGSYFDEALGPHPRLDPTEQPRISDGYTLFMRRPKRGDIYPALIGATSVVSTGKPPRSWTREPDVLWDSLEFFHADLVAKRRIRETGDGRLVRTDSRPDGRADLRDAINPDLAMYEPPMEMLENGQIVVRPPDQLRALTRDPIREDVPRPLRDPLDAAIEQFQRRGATEHDKRSAVKHLADVLEPLRKEIDEFLLPADEGALFNIANGFYIRHNNRTQQRNYDGEVWLDWMFHVYLATARALFAVLDRQTMAESVLGEPPDDGGGLSF